MAKIDDSKVLNRDIICVGEVKFEIIQLDSGLTAGDYVVSNLQNPESALSSLYNHNTLFKSAAFVDETLEDGKAIVLASSSYGTYQSTVLVIGY